MPGCDGSCAHRKYLVRILAAASIARRDLKSSSQPCNPFPPPPTKKSQSITSKFLFGSGGKGCRLTAAAPWTNISKPFRPWNASRLVFKTAYVENGASYMTFDWSCRHTARSERRYYPGAQDRQAMNSQLELSFSGSSKLHPYHSRWHNLLHYSYG